MTTTAEDIEAVVRRVLQRMLADQAAQYSDTSVSESAASGNSTSKSLDLNGHRLITLASLPANLDGITVAHLGENAVVTPTVKDLFRARKIATVRGTSVLRSPLVKSEAAVARMASVEAATSSKPQRIIVAGHAAWYGALRASLCPKQTKLTDSAGDDAASLRTIAAGIRDGHQAGVLIASSAHAVCWQAARDDKLRPVVVQDWLESKQILKEVPANLMILCSRRWNGPSTSNLVRTFFDYLKGIH